MDHRLSSLLIVLAISSIALAVHVFALAPYRLELVTHQVDLGMNLRIVQISDLHSRGLGQRERDLLELVREARPDLIVVTGDSVTDAPCEAASETLNQLRAPLGVWLVPGNWEHWMAAKQGEKCLCPANVHCLRNRAEVVRDALWIAGVDDALTGAADLPAALSAVPAEARLLLLSHEPTTFDSLQRPALVFSGHTHGGQVCLPGIGALVLPPGSGRYESGWYQRGLARMYVSRGVGTSLVSARLWCTPEVTLFVGHSTEPGTGARHGSISEP